MTNESNIPASYHRGETELPFVPYQEGVTFQLLQVDINNSLWIGTDFGLNFYDQSIDRFWHINHDPSNPNSLSNDLIRTIFRDASGTVWVGTYGGGLNHYDWRKNKFHHFFKVYI